MLARHLPRLYSKLFCQPVLLEAGARMAFEQSLLSLMFGEPASLAAALPSAAQQSPQDAQKRASRLLEFQGDTAILHLDGPIDRHLSAFEVDCFDALDANDVITALKSLEYNPDVANVLLYFNSPGGSVAGIPETAARVAQLAEKKNVFAYTDGLCCSAAYWIAAQADQIFANDSAKVGSIGVYLALLNSSAQMEALGRKIETIQDGKLKTAGAYWKPLADDERAHLQEEVNAIGTQFRAAVTAKRPQIARDSMEGQGFSGTKAVQLGLADAVRPDLQSVLAEFRKS